MICVILLSELLPQNLAVALVVVVLAAAIWWKFRHDLLFPVSKKMAEGTIVNWMSARVKGQEFFYPMIEFTTVSGERKVFRAEERSEGRPLFPAGTRVEVWYLPSNPEIRKIKYPRPA